MKNFFRNKAVIGAGCVIVALIVSFALIPLFNESIGAKTDVIRVIKNIEAGEQITKDQISVITVGGYNMASNVTTNMDEVVGKYAVADLQQGDYVLTGKLSEEPLINYPYLYDFQPNERAMSIEVESFASGLSGKLEAGDIVSVVAKKYGELKETVMPLELQYVEVLNVTKTNGYDIDEEEKENLAYGEDEAYASVTVKVVPEQTIALADVEANGDCHIVLVYRGYEDKKQAYLNQQMDIIEQIKADAIATEVLTQEGQEIQTTVELDTEGE